MKKIMFEVEVSVDADGCICIEQGNYPEEPASVFIHQDQAEIICKWILDAAKGSAE